MISGVPWDNYEREIAEVTGDPTCDYCGVVGHEKDFCLQFHKSKYAVLLREFENFRKIAWSRWDKVVSGGLWFVAGASIVYFCMVIQ